MLHKIGFRFLFLFVFALPLACFSQSAEWWQNNVKWDGVSHWSRYIKTVPKYLGPNALSVPVINGGNIDSMFSVGLTANIHTSAGDNTQNLSLYLNYTTKNNSIAINVQFVPYEQFQMSHQVKTERNVFFVYYNRKRVVGDVVASTSFQIFPKLRDKVQLAGRFGVRMPSGGLIALARYADVPAYFLDLGAGVPITNTNWKWISMAGFFVWQTNHETHRQDDAKLYGSGFEWNKNGIRLQAYAAGYVGYENNGDRPSVARLYMEKKNKRKVWILGLQQGLHDFGYFSVEAGGRILL
jgi:hypothetical protein